MKHLGFEKPVIALLYLVCFVGSQIKQGFAIKDQGSTTIALSSSDPEYPTWPNSYSLSYTFSLPYTSVVQQDAVKYNVDVFLDGQGKHPKLRMDTLNGTNSYIIHHSHEYEILPRIDEQVCRIFKTGETGDDVSSLGALPDVSGWNYAGIVAFEDNQDAYVWEYKAKHQGKIVTYTFWVTPSGTPLRLQMHGTELFTAAHFDEWIVDYTSFVPGPPPTSTFDPPPFCDDPGSILSLKGCSPASARTALLLPRVRYAGDEDYDTFLSTHANNRRHQSLQEYHMRREIFLRNHAKISLHNSQPKRKFNMTMNRFGDWTREEFEMVMLPKKHRARQQRASNNNNNASMDNASIMQKKYKRKSQFEIPYSPKTDIRTLPTSVDWSGSGANGGGVKDQALCGSCWAFGAVGAMEAAWFMSMGEQVSFSEQQVMDCSWGYLPDDEESASACNGGDAWVGISHISEAGGISLTRDYQYLGQGNFCKERSSPTKGKFKGFTRIPQFNDQALMEALYSRGPIAVSLDASQESFTFYSTGVYYDPACMWHADELDHSMMLVGYGTDEHGEDYWLIKNSWSANWGDNGYVKVSRDNHGCGASTDAVYAVVDEEWKAE